MVGICYRAFLTKKSRAVSAGHEHAQVPQNFFKLVGLYYNGFMSEPVKEPEVALQTITTTYEDYVGRGGILDPESFGHLESFEGLEGNRINASSLKAFISQANSMTSFAKVELTSGERDMYVFLRTLPQNSAPVKSGLKRPQGLTDQVLLAEIFRVTDPTKREKFVSKYPNIFHP